ncbi:coiled-coil domain-containing protein [Rhodopirellula sallentina]|uniref:Signal peptide protein n=1 Tax=Rhodopirellula sallentina SM41 TaxID=1263870 RepID=M5UQG5_9BACT|nr:hypothetical protein [Rhodopirellula sallentina]EMI58208.1 signal peptide protein [Rhodopirellula sallentina SM41]
MHGHFLQRFAFLGILTILISLSVSLVGGVHGIAVGQETDADKPDPLVARQTSVAARYARLEELLLRLADVEARENPERAALLKRVARQSRERFVLEKLRGASDLIADGQLSKALDDQKTATTELQGLLKLLLSEDRSSRIRDEKKRIGEIIKQLRLTERNERSVRARTENGVDLDEVLREQEEISKRAEQLNEELKDENEDGESDDEDSENGSQSESESQTESDAQSDSDSANESSESSESESSESESSESESSESESSQSDEAMNSESSQESPSESDSEQSQSNSESSENSSEQSESQQSQSQPSESQQSESQQGESQQGESQQGEQDQQPQSPEQDAQDQLEKAIERMKKAQDKLAQNERGAATEEQRQAEEELRKAIDKLEKILRQLREEEIQRELAKLESRLRKMAAMQSAVLDDTAQLAQTPQSQRDRATDLKAGDLAFEEQKITLEADRAMLLLKEEGSSVAFPEVILQLREDTKRVTTRLGQSKIDAVTQGIQSDILAALEEMIAALAKAQRDNEKKQQQQQQDGGQQPNQGSGEEPLVQALAELKLLRTMQSRIQGTTDRYGGLLDADNAGGNNSNGEEILPLLRDLAQRQDRLYQITRDLVTKRNR